MPETENAVTFKSAIDASISNLRTFFVSSAGSEFAAVLVMMLVVGLFTGPIALFADAQVTGNGPAPTNPCQKDINANSTTQTSDQVKVADATASGNSFDIYTSRSGGDVKRVSEPLSVQNGLLPPNICLGTVVSDLVRSDGEVIPANQVTTWAISSNAGLQVFVYVEVSPRYGEVTQAGGYSGSVSMDDGRAVGGNIPLTVHIEYPRLWRATMVCILAAWIGFFWAWLIHLSRADIPVAGRFWLYVILQVAILTIVAFPVVNAQILTNPNWSGDLSQYIALATIAGGGALATTPTLRALIDRAANFTPGGSGPSTATDDMTVPEVTEGTPADTPAGIPAGDDGGALTTPAADDSGALTTTPQGSDGSALPAPQDGNGGTLTAPAASSTSANPTTPADPTPADPTLADPTTSADPTPTDPADPTAPDDPTAPANVSDPADANDPAVASAPANSASAADPGSA